MMHTGRLLLLLCLALPGPSARAEQAGAEPAKFTVSGEALSYDTEASDESEIANGDVDEMLTLLRANPGITKLRLNSSGGSVWAAKEMARMAIDFELDTLVDGECSSSCVRIFLGGAKRTLARGSKIGFHARHWSPEAAQNYYERWKEDEGWTSPFDFVSWVYRDTYGEAYEEMTWAISRGVEPAFAIEIHAPRESIWFPTRPELRDAGILND